MTTTATAPKCWNCLVGFGIDADAKWDSEHGPLCDFCTGLELDANPEYVPVPLAGDGVVTAPSRKNQMIINHKIVQDGDAYDIITPANFTAGNCVGCGTNCHAHRATYTREMYAPAVRDFLNTRAVFQQAPVCTDFALKHNARNA